MNNKDKEEIVDLIMKLSKEDRKEILKTISWRDDENILSFLIWDKWDCIIQYLNLDSDEWDDWETIYGECDTDNLNFGEEEYNGVIDFLVEDNKDLIWEILGLDRFDPYTFVNSLGIINEGYETRQDYFEWDYETIIDKVLGHPLYKSYMRDIKIKELGL